MSSWGQWPLGRAAEGLRRWQRRGGGADAGLPGSPEQPFIDRLMQKRAPLSVMMDWFGLVRDRAAGLVHNAASLCSWPSHAGAGAASPAPLHPSLLSHRLVEARPLLPFPPLHTVRHPCLLLEAPRSQSALAARGPPAPVDLWRRLRRPHPVAHRGRHRPALQLLPPHGGILRGAPPGRAVQRRLAAAAVSEEAGGGGGLPVGCACHSLSQPP